MSKLSLPLSIKISIPITGFRVALFWLYFLILSSWLETASASNVKEVLVDLIVAKNTTIESHKTKSNDPTVHMNRWNRRKFPLPDENITQTFNKPLIQLLEDPSHKFETPYDPDKVIPFYYYSDPNKFPNLLNICPQTVPSSLANWQQGDDITFLKKALKHPWRTLDPSKALVFVVPAFLNVVVMGFKEWLGKNFSI